MDLQATFLVLLSALLHPLRDLTLKSIARPEMAYVGVTASWVAFAAAQAAASGQSLTLGPETWPAVAISAAGLTAYYFGTLSALRVGDLSVYYPIIRSSPLLIVTISWLFLGAAYSAATLVGIVLIVLAGFALQYRPGQAFGNARALALAVLAMAGSAAYTIVDARAMQTAQAPAFLFWVYTLLTPVFAFLLLALNPKTFERDPQGSGKGTTAIGAQTGAGPAIALGNWLARVSFAAATSYLSYYLILLAFQAGADPAATSAVRQASIPVSVVLAAVILGESRFLHRLGWAAVLALGIPLVAIAG